MEAFSDQGSHLQAELLLLLLSVELLCPPVPTSSTDTLQKKPRPAPKSRACSKAVPWELQQRRKERFKAHEQETKDPTREISHYEQSNL